MTKADVIANAKANNVSAEDLQILENTPENQFETNEVDAGKTSDITSQGANVMSSNIAPESTGLDSETGSSDSIIDKVDKSPPPEQPYVTQGYQLYNNETGEMETVSAQRYLEVMGSASGVDEETLRNRKTNRYYINENFFLEGNDNNETELRERLNIILAPLKVKIKETGGITDALEFTYKDGTTETISYQDSGIWLTYRPSSAPEKFKGVGGVQRALSNEERAEHINDIIDMQVDYLTNPESPGYDENFDWGLYSGAYSVISRPIPQKYKLKNSNEGNKEWNSMSLEEQDDIISNELLKDMYSDVPIETSGGPHPEFVKYPDVRADYERHDIITLNIINNNKDFIEELTVDELSSAKSNKFGDLFGLWSKSDDGKLAVAEIEVEKQRIHALIMSDIMATYKVVPQLDDNGFITGFVEDPNWAKEATALYDKRMSEMMNDIYSNNPRLMKAVNNFSFVVNNLFDGHIQDASARDKRRDIAGTGYFGGDNDFYFAIHQFLNTGIHKNIQDFKNLREGGFKQQMINQKNKFEDFILNIDEPVETEYAGVSRFEIGADWSQVKKSSLYSFDLDASLGQELMMTKFPHMKYEWTYQEYEADGKKIKRPIARVYTFDKEKIKKDGYVDVPIWFDGDKPVGDYNGNKILGVANPKNEKLMFGDKGEGGHMMMVRFENIDDGFQHIKNQQLLAELYQNKIIIDGLVESENYQKELSSTAIRDSELYDVNGNWNLTIDNWQKAMGDQSMMMLSSILTLGGYTFVVESAGLYAQAIELQAIKDSNGKWDKMSKEERLNSMNRVIDQNPDIIDQAYLNGGVNMMLDNISNVFLIGKVAKPVTANLSASYKMFIQGNIKASIQNLYLKQGVKKVTSATLMETIIETLQEGNTQLGLGRVVDGYQFNKHPLVNAASTAALTTPVFMGAATTTKTFVSSISQKIVSMKADPEMIIAWAGKQKDALIKERAENKISQEEFQNRMMAVDATYNGFVGLGKKDGKFVADQLWTDENSMKTMFEIQMKIEQERLLLQELELEKKKAKKRFGGYDADFDGAKNKSQLDAAIKKIIGLEYEKTIVNHTNAYKTKGIVLAHEINNNPNIPFKAQTFDKTQEAIDYLNSIGLSDEILRQIDPLFMNELAGGFILDSEKLAEIWKTFNLPTPLLPTQGLAIVSNETVEKTIRKGNVFTSNTVHHEYDHILLSSKTDVEVKGLVKDLELELTNSKDPQVQEILKLYNIRVKQYENARKGGLNISERGMNEEKIAALGDALSAIYNGGAIQDENGQLVYLEGVLTTEGRTAFLNIAEDLNNLIHGEGSQRSVYDAENSISFLANNPKTLQETIKDEIAIILSDNGIPMVSTVANYSLAEGGVDLQIVREAANMYYKPNRSQQEIVEENNRLEQKIREAENYVNENKELQAKVRAGARKWREQLMFNNWGAFEDVLKAYDRSNPAHSSLNEEIFNSENLESFVKAVMVTWKGKMLDKETGNLKEVPFAAYYFGSTDGRPSIAKLRQAAIFEMLDKQFKQDITEMDYDITSDDTDVGNTISLMDQVNDYNERSQLVHTIPGFEWNEETQTGSDAYNKWVDKVAEIMVTQYDLVYDENFKSKIRKEGRKFFNQLKKDFEGGVIKNYLPTQSYIDFITNNAELIYNQMPQKVMNENFTEFTDVIEERGSAKDLKMRKDLKTGDIYSGTSIRKKKTWTPEIEALFLEKLLKTNEIAGLKAQGLDNAQIHKIVRMDMTTKGTLQHLSDILFKDAIMQATNNPEFKATNGVDNQQVMQAAMMIDRGMDVKFSIIGDLIPGPKEVTITGGQYFDIEGNPITINQMWNQVQEVVYPFYQKVNEDEATVVDMILNDPQFDNIPMNVRKFFANTYSAKLPMDAETRDFVQFIKTSIPGISKDVLADVVNVNVLDRKDIRDNMVKNAKELVTIFPKEVLDVVGLEWLGYKGGNRYLNNSEKVKNPNWKKGDPVEDKWLKNKDGSLVTGEQYNSFNETKNLAKTAEELGISLDFDPKDISIYNKNTPLKSNGIFKEIINLNERIAKGEITKREAQSIIKETGLIEKIEKANKANIGLLTMMYKSIAVKLKDGKLDEAALLQLFKMQSNLVGGFRGLSRLDGFNLLDGKFKFNPKDEGVTWKTDAKGKKIILWKGEHAASMSKVDANVMQLMYSYKDGEINQALFNAQLEVELAGYGQVLGHNGHFDVLDKYGKTNVSDTYRFNLLDYKTLRQYNSIYGENMKDMQMRILLDLDRKKEIVNSIKKEMAIVNIIEQRKIGVERGASVFDFDSTLEQGGSNIIVATHPETGEVIDIKSHDFHSVVGDLTEKGFEFNFDDFVNVKESEKGLLFEKFQNQIEKYGVDNVVILTARQPEAAVAIQAWLKQNGINLPIENITGLGVSGPDGKPITVKGTDKARWIEENLIWDGFSDIYFVDDGQQIVQDVRNMFDTYPPGLLKAGGKSVLADPNYNVYTNESYPNDKLTDGINYSFTGPNVDLNTTFNEIIESSTGIGSEKRFSTAEGTIRGRNHFSIMDKIYPASAYDLEMFTYRYITEGALGENQKAFFQEKLFKPFAEATNAINTKKQQVKNNYKNLIKEVPTVKKSLKDNVEGTSFSKEQAVRVFLWQEAGFEIPGLAPTTQTKLYNAVKNDPEMLAFAQKLGILSQQENGYIKPTEYWTIENIAFDLSEITGNVGRAQYLKGWKTNVDIIFSEENKAKLRAAYGNEHVEALEDMLYRMEYGRNRNRPGRIENAWNNWVNNSVGAIMFFNMRSAFLQTISAANYVDMKNNNILEAGKRIANVPQFAKDFAYIFNSDMLKQRRAGNERTINEAELTARLEGSTNKVKATIAFLLEKGFLPTQIADSFAISSGGATYYRSQVMAYEKQGMTTQEAETQAWLDFQEKTEMGQQSSRPDLISQQQAGGLGRILLAFKNTPMQYTRIMIKSAADLKNGRGSVKENIGKIVYYGALQNAIFTTLQTALWAALGDDEDMWDTKKERVANGMIDSILNGMGITGSVAVTIKNGYLRYSKEKERGFKADHTRTIIEFANLSPTIGSKLRKMYSSIQTEQFNSDVIEEMGFTIENPGFNAMANLVSATTNIPLDRAVQKVQNLMLAADSETEFWDSFALTLGWNPWDLGVESEAKKVRADIKEKKKIEEKQEKLRNKYPGKTDKEIVVLEKGKETRNLNKRQQNMIIKSLDLDPTKYKTEKDRVNAIIEQYNKDPEKINKVIEDAKNYVPSEEEIRLEKREKELNATTKKDQVNTLLELGLSTKEISSLKYEKDRVKKIMELENKKKVKNNKNK